jgi:photosystem II stability/assembly factor-like uncharacterized protein
MSKITHREFILLTNYLTTNNDLPIIINPHLPYNLILVQQIISMSKNAIMLFLFFLGYTTLVQAQHIEILQQGTSASGIRGLSVVDDQVAWVSGSRGYVAITRDGGKTWASRQVRGFEHADFRDIEAFSDKEAVIISSGTPALILKTTDGGSNWQVKYRNTDTAYFLDAMDFDSHKHGLVLGDPIQSKFLLLETNDAGESWQLFKNLPEAMPGEAAFAASGTCLSINEGTINIVTGGSAAHLFTAYTKDPLWNIVDLPLQHGASSKGAFSIADGWVIVGGNYAKNKNRDSIACISRGNIKPVYKLIEKGPDGYQSCVELINKNTYLSTGTPGSNISTNNGKTWSKIDNSSYNVCRKAKNGKLVLLAGDKGKIGILVH